MVKRDVPPQLAKARDVFAASFPSPEAKTKHYRELGRKSAEGRVVLRADEAAAVGQATAAVGQASEALADAYRLLQRIAERGKIPTPATGTESSATAA